MRCANVLIPVLLGLALAACETTPEREPEPPEEPAEPIDETPAEAETPENAEARYTEALDYMRSGRIDAARRELRALLEARPEASGPPANLGILAARDERYAEARALLEEAITRNPDNLVARNWLAHSHREDRQPERAERAWLDALERDPDYVAAHINLARLYEDVLADLPAAVRHYRAAYESSEGEVLQVLPRIARLEQRLQESSTDGANGRDDDHGGDAAE